MANTIDLQAIDRGLGALAGLMQTADVRATVAVFRADFVAASQQIDVLGDYKDLHDQLHDLQFLCYNYIASQVARFPEDELVVESLLDHELTFRGIVARLQEVASRPTVAGELTWIPELVEAKALLQQALEGKDSAALKRCCRLVKRVMDRYPSLINARLNAAARSLRMEAIEAAMAAILKMLRSYATSSQDIQAFEAGLASLAELNQRLTCLVRDHDRWQDVDVELRRVEAALSSDPEELELSWSDIKARTMPLMCGDDEGWIQALLRESTRLDDALADKDPVKARQHFKRFQRQAAERFYRVDGELKKLCGQLRTIGAPLAAVAQLVAAAAGAVPTQRGHRRRELGELSRQYDELTSRIAALDEDLGRTLDGEQRWVLKRRRDERAAERDELVAIRSQIEDQLAGAPAG